MNLLANKTLNWWQIGLLKLSMLAIGIAIGAHLSAVFLPYLAVLLALGVALGLYLAVVWFRQ
jgi:hypothetical protein